jgi:hypothetical protein
VLDNVVTAIPKATIADLLKSKGEDKKTFTLKTVGSMEVTIKRLKTGDLSRVYGAAKDNVIDQVKYIVLAGLVEPKLGIEQIDSLEFDVFMEIANEISEFSGISKEALQEGKP